VKDVQLNSLQICSDCHVAKSVSKYIQNKLDLVGCPSNVNFVFLYLIIYFSNGKVISDEIKQMKNIPPICLR